MEAKDLFELIGYQAEGDEIKPDEVREHFNKTFVPVEQLSTRKDLIEPLVNKSYGERVGKLETKFISLAKNNGLDVSHSDFKDKNLEEIADDIFSRYKTTIEKKADGGNEDFQKQLDKIKAERDQFQNSTQEWQQKYNELDSTYKEKEIKNVVTSARQKALDKIKWPAGTNDLTKRGFISTFEDEFDTDVEGDNVFVVHKSGDYKGSRVQHPKQANKMLTLDEAIELKAKERGVWDDSPHNGQKPKPEGKRQQPEQPSAERPKNARPMHPRFAAFNK